MLKNKSATTKLVEDEFLTIAQLGTMLQLKESHIRKMIANKHIPYLKAGRLVRFKKMAIERWLEQESECVK